MSRSDYVLWGSNIWNTFHLRAIHCTLWTECQCVFLETTTGVTLQLHFDIEHQNITNKQQRFKSVAKRYCQMTQNHHYLPFKSAEIHLARLQDTRLCSISIL